MNGLLGILVGFKRLCRDGVWVLVRLVVVGLLVMLIILLFKVFGLMLKVGGWW